MRCLIHVSWVIECLLWKIKAQIRQSKIALVTILNTLVVETQHTLRAQMPHQFIFTVNNSHLISPRLHWSVNQLSHFQIEIWERTGRTSSSASEAPAKIWVSFLHRLNATRSSAKVREWTTTVFNGPANKSGSLRVWTLKPCGWSSNFQKRTKWSVSSKMSFHVPAIVSLEVKNDSRARWFFNAKSVILVEKDSRLINSLQKHQEDQGCYKSFSFSHQWNALHSSSRHADNKPERFYLIFSNLNSIAQRTMWTLEKVRC